MIKLIAMDMDGTLLAPDSRISERNAQMLWRLKEAGIEPLICTGRSYQAARAPLAEHGLMTPAVCLNGAAVYGPSGELSDKKVLTGEQVKACMTACSEADILFDFATAQRSMTTNTEDRFRQIYESGVLYSEATPQMYRAFLGRFRFLSEEELLSGEEEICKISLFHEQPERLLRVEAALRQIPELAVTSSGPNNLELTHRRAQKGKALMAYAREHRIRPEEIMAIGDSDNDYSMLSLDLGVTVAMANGSESAKRAARYLTCSNAEDGVAEAVEAFVLSRREVLAG